MFSGHNFIGFKTSRKNDKIITVFSTLQQEILPGEFAIATNEEIEEALAKASSAFEVYKKTSPGSRAVFLETIAEEIMALGDPLIERAMLETGLPEQRLQGERGRTVGQLKLFAGLLREGSWVEAIIDPALPGRKPLPRPDLRRILQPIGPVVVFGASNFPFAFSTAGGDTASALAAGCPVIIKAHNSHLGTNELVAKAVVAAALKCNMPEGVFSSLIGEGAKLGQYLAKHPAVKAIGFTGSYKAGMSLYKAAVNEREVPIPVYAEMSSINPVLLFPEKLEADTEMVAAQVAGSITLGVGQFCTNPGLLFALKGEKTETFKMQLTEKLKATAPAVMLNKTICSSYYNQRTKISQAKGVTPVYVGEEAITPSKGSTALLEVTARDFIDNAELQQEMFGPASVLVICNDHTEMLKAVQSLDGQLTGTIFSTAGELDSFSDSVDALASKVGRIIFNGVPTGVEVSHAMVHGGPFPATTDSRSTSVGAEAIKRFVRPICFQDFPAEFLPDALKNENPLGIMRKVDGNYTREAVTELQLM